MTHNVLYGRSISGMTGAYDSWNPQPDDTYDSVIRGPGYALGGGNKRTSIRMPVRWRTHFWGLCRMALLELCVVLFPICMALMFGVWRHVWSFLLACLSLAFCGLYFRNRRMDHEKRPR